MDKYEVQRKFIVDLVNKWIDVRKFVMLSFLLLRDGQRTNYSEIADVVDISSNTAKKLMKELKEENVVTFEEVGQGEKGFTVTILIKGDNTHIHTNTNNTITTISDTDTPNTNTLNNTSTPTNTLNTNIHPLNNIPTPTNTNKTPTICSYEDNEFIVNDFCIREHADYKAFALRYGEKKIKSFIKRKGRDCRSNNPNSIFMFISKGLARYEQEGWTRGWKNILSGYVNKYGHAL